MSSSLDIRNKSEFNIDIDFGGKRKEGAQIGEDIKISDEKKEKLDVEVDNYSDSKINELLTGIVNIILNGYNTFAFEYII